ncbi:uncharacterized protein LOC116116765 [Pistacia vera]|uniref:uncharacterized protein LOC116116765 n=1 Tax=Pistacia vera TaxID=55513 RepID=UPI001262E70B|nr:uncharacterized protein LOC116116765 [Pistacia vera]
MQSFCFFFSLIWDKFNGVEVLGAILLAISSKAEKLLKASPSAKETRLLNTNGRTSFREHLPRHTLSIDFDGEEDIFFDCEEWPLPESEPEDDFQSANGDFSPCSSSSESESSMIVMGMSMGMGLSMDMGMRRGVSMEMDMDTRMTMANGIKNKTVLSKNEPPRDFLARERNLSHFFHQDHFWNYGYKYKDFERHKQEGETLENGRKLAQFLEDSYWVNQAGGVDRHKKIFPCLPTTIDRPRSKRKPPSSFSDAMPPPPPQPQPDNDESKTRKRNMRKHSRCTNCLPKAFSWLHCRGRKKLSPAPIEE